MSQVHADLFRSVLFFFGVLGVWGLYQWVRGYAPSGSYLGALVLGEGLVLIQALTGIILVATGGSPDSGLHWLYGAVILLTLPVVYVAWATRVEGRRASLLYAAAAIFVVIIAAVRSQGTG